MARRRWPWLLATTVLAAAIAWAAFAPLHIEDRDEVFAIPKGTYARRMSGDKVDILIDAGTSGAYPALEKKLRSLPQAKRVFELLVVTHIDIDHIGGVLPLLDGAASLDVYETEPLPAGSQIGAGNRPKTAKKRATASPVSP